ncbi:hypothetical protein Sjap_011809 [Stephania japonica]|uniref:PGG domain-containing protein n=1 Tax=Stephania japonica TaxID=461633 RepID=A0AAP0JBV1_9MAGN
MVKLLLTAAPDICLHKDGYGLPPLHLAVMKGNRVDILKELLQSRPQAIDIMLHGGETILHLCVNNSRLEELEMLLQWLDDHQHEVSDNSINVNSTDGRRNTVLHLAVAKKHIQIIKLLLAHGVQVNALNQNGFTALDILTQSTSRDFRDIEILEVLQGAGGLRANDARHQDLVVEVRDNHATGINNKIGRGREPALGKYEKELKQKLNAMMVVASLIAGIGFQAALNPPSGLIKKPPEEYEKQHAVKDAFAPSNEVDEKNERETKRDENAASKKVVASSTSVSEISSSSNPLTSDEYYSWYMFSNAIAVLGSLMVILLVIGGLPFNGLPPCVPYVAWAGIGCCVLARYELHPSVHPSVCREEGRKQTHISLLLVPNCSGSCVLL